MIELSLLRSRMIEDITVRSLSLATQRSYVQAGARFGRFFNRPPPQLGERPLSAPSLVSLRGSGVVGLGVPAGKIADAVDRVIGDACEPDTLISVRIPAVRLCGPDQGLDDRCPLAARSGAPFQPDCRRDREGLDQNPINPGCKLRR